jgi:glycosyltransferase involved in cell wall biosynthesis
MKLLVICETFPPEVDAKASRFSEFFPIWQQKHIDVTLLTRAPNFPTGTLYAGYKNSWRSESEFHGARIVRLWSYLAPNAGFIRRILGFSSFMIRAIIAACGMRKADVVLATSPSLFSAMAGYMIATLWRRPFVFEVRDLWPEAIMAVGAMRETILTRMLTRIAAHMYRHASHITTVGEGYKAQLMEWYGVAEDNITVIPNGILPEQFAPHYTQEEARQRLGLAPDKRYVMYMGTHGHAHRLDVVIDACALLDDMPDVICVFVGEGAEKKALKEYALRKGVQERCMFIDQQTKAQVPLWYDAVDVALVLLRDHPLFRGTVPSKTYEAMAMRTPIICNVPGACGDIINAAHAGRVIIPESPQAMAEAIRALVADTTSLAAMGASARQYVLTHYDRRDCAARYAALLHTISK